MSDGARDREGLDLLLAEARVMAGLPVGHLDVTPRTARAIAFAESVGAPLAPALALARDAAEDRRMLAAEVRRASAEGRAVAIGLVLAPPVLGPATAALVTDAPLAFLSTSLGRGMVAVAAVLWLVGVIVVVGMVRAAAVLPEAPEDELLELMATAVRAGLSPAAAARAAGSHLGRVGRRRGEAMGSTADRFAWWLALGGVGEPPPAWGWVAGPLRDATAAGVAVAPLLLALAARERGARMDAARVGAARLGARLSLPTALLLLPAALLLIAGPLLVSVVGEMT